MKSAGVLCLIFALTALPSCRPTQKVHASNETTDLNQPQGDPTIDGDLYSIDMVRKTMVIRVENGMAQTFRWDDNTEMDPVIPASATAAMKQLSLHRGSQLSVRWKDFNEEKLATAIVINDLAAQSPAKPRLPRSARRQVQNVR